MTVTAARPVTIYAELSHRLNCLTFTANQIAVWIAASADDPRPGVQQFVIGAVLANDQPSEWILYVAVNVVNLDPHRQWPPKGVFGPDYMGASLFAIHRTTHIHPSGN